MEKNIGRPVRWEMVRRVKDLREGEPQPSLETIARMLSREAGKRIHKTSVERWYKRIPQLQ